MKKKMLNILLLLCAADLCISIFNAFKIKQVKMLTQDQFDALVGRLDAVSTDIATDYKTLLAAVKNGTPVSDESVAKAEANISKLEALGSSVENPVPEDGGGDTGDNGGGGDDTGSGDQTSDAMKGSAGVK